MSAPLVPARLRFTGDGIPWSEAYADIYHSADGGPGQARHVFLGGNGLPARWANQRQFVILETGFGTGLNFLATWVGWQTDPRRPERLHYLSVEKHPFQAADLRILHRHWPEFARYSDALCDRWPTLVPGCHRLEFESGRIVLTLLLGDAETLVGQLVARPDAIYLDGFSPMKNPEMWSDVLLRRLGRLAAPGCTLATWSVASVVRQGLRTAGFLAEKRPGYGHKREMLAAHFAPPPYLAPAALPPPPVERSALVIGAGLAGCASVERLAARGWRVTLLERHREPAREASGNPAGIVMPLVARDDSIPARLTRAAYLHSLRAWQQLAARGHAPRWSSCGVLQLARDLGHEDLQRRTVAELDYPQAFLGFLEKGEVSACIGQPVATGGWLFRQGGWASPPSVCRTLMAGGGDGVRLLWGVEVAKLQQRGGRWQALDATGANIAEAQLAILTSGAELNRLQPTALLPLQRVRGQITLVPAERLAPLPLVVCREGYVTPAVDGDHCVGASYGLDDDPAPRPEDNLGNLARLQQLLPDLGAPFDASELRGRVGFRAVAPDRLPLAGTLPDYLAPQPGAGAHLKDLPRLPGMYCLLGLASRGLVWAGLMAELLASQIEGEPLPLESDLVAAVDPGRFLLKALRHGQRISPNGEST